ncbi:HSP90 family protein [Kutzneria kofuensis]|uniref:Molecular chaperone HtpG n=1 Tax=Kutzneria kofuensis TaxID=103725 RepID=A0A7W9KNL3_9PSEU|nr:HSP90 family protein [Kutzneria kofuensis]MBB5895874.1 molecular chaperone HtpG [Kutzneria kofuensis]
MRPANPTMPGTFQVDLRGLVALLSRHLYRSPDVYIRELLQNAVDAVAARRRFEPGVAGAVEIDVVEPGDGPPEVIVTDNGIGLTGTELVELLATIGRSSKRGELSRHRDYIGQFGIGLLACFLVADEITVVTRSAKDPDARALRWQGRADGTYDITPVESDLPAGTRVHLRARPGSEHRLSRGHVLRLTHRYGGLLPLPVRLGSTRVNDEPPPWELPALTQEQERENALSYARRVLDLDPLDAIPLHADGVRGLAFVLPYEPSPAARQDHRVYLRRMLLSESADRLLPDWAFFVRCVIDADDLRPNAARDGFVEDARLDAVREQLGRCIRDHLTDLARLWPSRLAGVVAMHHAGISALAVHDEQCLLLFADWLPVDTSLGRMTLGEHARRFGELRFVRRCDDFRRVAPIAAAQGRCVVNGGPANVSTLLDRLALLRPERKIVELDPTEVVDSFTDLSVAEQAEVADLVRLAESALWRHGVGVQVRAFAPTQMHATLVAPEGCRSRRQLGRAQSIVDGPVALGPASHLCLNFANAAVRELARQARQGRIMRVRRAVELLYVQALLLGHHPLRDREFSLLDEVVLDFVEDRG